MTQGSPISPGVATLVRSYLQATNSALLTASSRFMLGGSAVFIHKLLMRYVDDCYLIVGYFYNKAFFTRSCLLESLLAYFEESWQEFTKHFAAMYSAVGRALKVEDPDSFIGFQLKIAVCAAISLCQLLPAT